METVLLAEDAETGRLVDVCAPAPAPSKPKRVSKKLRAALEAEYLRGYERGLEDDSGGRLVANLAAAVIVLALGVLLGAWLF